MSKLEYNSYKGDGNLRFSGQVSSLLRNLMSYYGEILHGGKLFGQLSGAEAFLAIQPPWRQFLKTTIFSPKRPIKHFYRMGVRNHLSSKDPTWRCVIGVFLTGFLTS